MQSDQDLLRDVVVCIRELLLDEIARFKHPAFREEREWRLIARPDLRRRVSDTTPTDCPLHNFRHSKGYLVPYIELRPGHKKLPLASVRFGPSLVASRCEDPLRMLLAANDFRDIQVVGSELPVICSWVPENRSHHGRRRIKSARSLRSNSDRRIAFALIT